MITLKNNILVLLLSGLVLFCLFLIDIPVVVNQNVNSVLTNYMSNLIFDALLVVYFIALFTVFIKDDTSLLILSTIILFCWRWYQVMQHDDILHYVAKVNSSVSIVLLIVLLLIYNCQKNSVNHESAYTKNGWYAFWGILSFLALINIQMKIPEDINIPTNVMPIATRINNFISGNTVMYVYIQNSMLSTFFIALTIVSMYYLIRENRLRTIFLISYGFLFVLGQSFLFSIIRPWHKQFEIYNYLLFGISVIGCLAIFYRYGVIEKNLFNKRI